MVPTIPPEGVVQLSRPSTWYHFFGTYDGTTLRIYLNGFQVDSQPATGNLAVGAGAAVLGKDGFFDNSFLNAFLDEARVSNTARSADWIPDRVQQSERAHQGRPLHQQRLHLRGGARGSSGALDQRERRFRVEHGGRQGRGAFMGRLQRRRLPRRSRQYLGRHHRFASLYAGHDCRQLRRHVHRRVGLPGTGTRQHHGRAERRVGRSKQRRLPGLRTEYGCIRKSD